MNVVYLISLDSCKYLLQRFSIPNALVSPRRCWRCRTCSGAGAAVALPLPGGRAGVAPSPTDKPRQNLRGLLKSVAEMGAKPQSRHPKSPSDG